jgi:hypothetical protein
MKERITENVLDFVLALCEFVEHLWSYVKKE